jgi:hypothetical protein
MLELETRPARNETLLELKELYIAREALVKDPTAARNRGKVLIPGDEARQAGQRAGRTQCVARLQKHVRPKWASRLRRRRWRSWNLVIPADVALWRAASA